MTEEYIARWLVLGGAAALIIGLLKYCGLVARRLLEFANEYLLRQVDNPFHDA